MAIFTIEEFNEMQEETSRFFGIQEEPSGPSKRAVDSILSYSKATGVKQTQSLGKLLMNLN